MKNMEKGLADHFEIFTWPLVHQQGPRFGVDQYQSEQDDIMKWHNVEFREVEGKYINPDADRTHVPRRIY
jgi:hypothetical protein